METTENEVTIIPVGYRLTISSWENDADNSQDEFVLKYAKLYLDRHGEYM